MTEHAETGAAAGNGLLRGKVAVVTGGGDGIGGAISRTFARAGARVFICDIDTARAQRTLADIRAVGGSAEALVGDIRDKSVTAQLHRDALAFGAGRVDILVNNAGHFMPYKRFVDSAEEDWDTQYQISFLHVLRCSRLFLETMYAQRSGAVIHVSSVEGQRGIPGNAVYSAFKAGLINFTRSLAVESGAFGVRINCLAPDMTHTPQTPMNDWLPERDKVQCWVPLGRFAQPDEQADVALFLASDLSRFVTGETINADGGTMAASGWYKVQPGVENWSNTPAMVPAAFDISPE
ncbi:MAG: SDR family oxidoreductase [Halioglobus sp.]|nr:SDR family oxidoreductase [Halioglobus sp.]